MKLIDYIRGDRRGSEANDLEKQAMEDPFLSDAIEGYDAVYGDHLDIVKRLENWVGDRAARRRQSRRRTIWGVSVAAAVVLTGAGLAYYHYAGYRPSSHTIAELLTEENPKTYISETEFRSRIEPAGALIAAANLDRSTVASDTTGTRKVESTAAAETVVQVAASASQTNAADGGTAVMLAADNTVETIPATKNTVAKNDAPVAAKQIAAKDVAAVENPGKIVSGEAVIVAEAAVTTQADDPTRPLTRSMPEEAIDTVYNTSFTEYFLEKRRPKVGDDGNIQSGRVLVEFRVNAAGVPSAIRVLSSFSREANREVIEMLVEGPRWEPTYDRRIRTIVEY